MTHFFYLYLIFYYLINLQFLFMPQSSSMFACKSSFSTSIHFLSLTPLVHLDYLVTVLLSSEHMQTQLSDSLNALRNPFSGYLGQIFRISTQYFNFLKQRFQL